MWTLSQNVTERQKEAGGIRFFKGGCPPWEHCFGEFCPLFTWCSQTQEHESLMRHSCHPPFSSKLSFKKKKKKRKWPLTLEYMNKSSPHGTKHENFCHRFPQRLEDAGLMFGFQTSNLKKNVTCSMICRELIPKGKQKPNNSTVMWLLWFLKIITIFQRNIWQQRENESKRSYSCL